MNLFRRTVASVCSCLLVVCTGAAADEVYQSPESFVSEAFGGSVPEPRMVWLTKPRQQVVKEILGHAYGALRVRYWTDGRRTAWVLEEIGKVKPITTGIVVDDRRIRRLQVLVYRESHGWEVKHPFFTNQFIDASLGPGRRLDRKIDGIAGATLSVDALHKLARVALYLDSEVLEEES